MSENTENKMEEKSENIVKKVCKELGLTYRELGERIGVKESSLAVMVSKDNISEQIQKAIELLIENENYKKEMKEYTQLKTILQKLSSQN
jgi:hypothetical protein